MYNLIEKQLTQKSITDIQNAFLISNVYNMFHNQMSGGYPVEGAFSSKLLNGIDIDEYIHKNFTKFAIEANNLFIILDTERHDIHYSYMKDNIYLEIRKDSLSVITYERNLEEESEFFFRKQFANYGNEYPVIHRLSFDLDLDKDLIKISEFHNFKKEINYSGYNINEIMPEVISTFINNDKHKRKELEDFLLLTHDISLEKYFSYSKICSTFEDLHNVLNKSKVNTLTIDKK